MSKARNACAVLMMLTLAACGGGGSDSTGTTAGTSSNTPGSATSNSTGSSSTGSTNTTGSTGTTGTGSTGTGTGTAASANLLKLVASQVLLSGVGFNLTQYQGTNTPGTVDPNAPGVGPVARDDFSPIMSFGFRPQANNRPTATGDTVRTSLVLTMTQRASDVQPGQNPQIFQFEFDAVDVVLSADHDVVKVSFPAGAKAWAYYRDPWNSVATGSSASLTQDLISLQPIADDTTSDLLSFNINPIMREIINADNTATGGHSIWNGVAPMHGTFDTSIVIGNTSMETDAFAPLPSGTVTFAGGGLPAVSGSLLAGAVQVAAD